MTATHPSRSPGSAFVQAVGGGGSFKRQNASWQRKEEAGKQEGCGHPRRRVSQGLNVSSSACVIGEPSGRDSVTNGAEHVKTARVTESREPVSVGDRVREGSSQARSVPGRSDCDDRGARPRAEGVPFGDWTGGHRAPPCPAPPPPPTPSPPSPFRKPRNPHSARGGRS